MRLFFSDPEPPTIKILHGWSGIYGHFSLCFSLFLFVILPKLIILKCIKVTTRSKTKSRFNQVLLKIDARRFRENNQQKCLDCLKPRSNKNELEC